MIKKILVGLFIVIGGFFAFAATRPGTYHVERSTKVDAPASLVFAQLDDFKSWAAWSPWEKMDPNMQKTFTGPPEGVGASYSWQGNDKVGKGKMTITGSQPVTGIKYKLEFIEPFAAVAESDFSLVPQGDQAVKVVWAMDGTNDLMGKVFGIFMNMDAAIGADFERGLTSLKAIAEGEAKMQFEQAEAAKARAAADAVAKVQAEATAAAVAAEAAATAAADAKKGKRKP